MLLMHIIGARPVTEQPKKIPSNKRGLIQTVLEELALVPYRNFILVAGMPRSGSMWTWNVVCELLERDGKKVERYDSTDPLVLEAIIHNPRRDHVACLHTHLYYNRHHTGKVKTLFTMRDIRECTLSAMRHSKMSFEDAMNWLTHTKVLDIAYDYRKNDPKFCKTIRFEEIKNEPERLIRDIAKYVGVKIDDVGVREVYDRLSLESVSKLTKGMQKTFEAAIKHADEKNIKTNRKDDGIQFETTMKSDQYSGLVTRNLDGSYRPMDEKTRFQGNHITNTKPDEWKTVLSEEEQEILEKVTRNWVNDFYPEKNG